uniref:Plastocyanin-like domain-containing protein n=1 Tax=Amphimedon queenslandica TaxID=400682 RepID=A0A1X7TWN3_AMPQE
MFRLSMLLEVFCLLIFFAHQQVIAEVVTCNHNTPVCECIRTNDEVCKFTLDIEMLQTFTRYRVDDTGDSRGTAGSVWRINNGEWEPVDPADNLCGTAITDPECTQPFGVDGYTFRSFIAVNGRIPGPTLIVTEGQLVKVNVINRLASESVSVHWHGMHQRNSNWMDGVEHVTQCEKDNTQRKILLSQLTDFDITSYEDNSEDHTLSFLDWQKSSSLDLFTQINSGIRYFDIDKASELSRQAEASRTYSSDGDGAEIGPVSYWSGLINGRGRHSSVDYINSSLSEFNVTAGNTYRFRLIGAQSLYAYRFSIEDHNLTVIATDGQFIEPVRVDYIIIHSGERYDFLLKAKEENKLVSTQYFIIHAVTLSMTGAAAPDYIEQESAEAILNYNPLEVRSSQYAGIAANRLTVSQRCASIDKCIALNCPFKNFPQSFNINCTHINELELLTDYPNEDLPTFADSRLFFNFGFEGTRLTSAINAQWQ